MRRTKDEALRAINGDDVRGRAASALRTLVPFLALMVLGLWALRSNRPIVGWFSVAQQRLVILGLLCLLGYVGIMGGGGRGPAFTSTFRSASLPTRLMLAVQAVLWLFIFLLWGLLHLRAMPWARAAGTWLMAASLIAFPVWIAAELVARYAFRIRRG